MAAARGQAGLSFLCRQQCICWTGVRGAVLLLCTPMHGWQCMLALHCVPWLRHLARACSQPHHMHSAAVLCHTQELTWREVLRGLFREVALLQLAASRRLQGREACRMAGG